MFSHCKVLPTTISLLALAAGPLLISQESHVRIVRVTYAEGVVQLNNQNVAPNMPIIEGNVLTTGTDSVAEVQFEDGSTMRLSPETQISFAQLARLSSGEAVTRADLDQGEAEFTIASRAAGMFAVFAHNKSILFKRAGRFRVLSTHADPLELAVWKGEAAVHDPETGTDVEVKANEMFTLAADDPQQYDLEKGIEADDLDRWSLHRDQELASDYVSVSGATPAISSAGFLTYGYVDPCQAYYWASYWTVPGYCFNSNYFYPPIGYGFVYFPGHHRFHHHPPHIHPPTPPVAAAAVKGASGSALVNARSANSVEHRPAIRVLNDENFKRSTPVLDKREMKEAEREAKNAAKNAEREMKKAEREAKNQQARTTHVEHAEAHVHASRDSGHAAAISSRSTYSPRASSSGWSGSHSSSGSSSGSSHSSSSSHSSGSSSGSSSHSSSGSSGGRGK